MFERLGSGWIEILILASVAATAVLFFIYYLFLSVGDSFRHRFKRDLDKEKGKIRVKELRFGKPHCPRCEKPLHWVPRTDGEEEHSRMNLDGSKASLRCLHCKKYYWVEKPKEAEEKDLEEARNRVRSLFTHERESTYRAWAREEGVRDL